MNDKYVLHVYLSNGHILTIWCDAALNYDRDANEFREWVTGALWGKEAGLIRVNDDNGEIYILPTKNISAFSVKPYISVEDEE